MLRNKFVIIMVAVLLVAVGAYNYSFFRAKTPLKPPSRPEQSLRTEDAAADSPLSIDSYRSEWQRDPFWYANGVDKSQHDGRSGPKVHRSGFDLEGTITKDGKGYALINGGVYGVGDKVRNATIVEISELYIKVRNGEGTRTIRIANDLIEKEK